MTVSPLALAARAVAHELAAAHVHVTAEHEQEHACD